MTWVNAHFLWFGGLERLRCVQRGIRIHPIPKALHEVDTWRLYAYHQTILPLNLEHFAPSLQHP